MKDQQCLAQAVTLNEFMKRLDHGLAQGARRTGGDHRFARHQGQQQAGQHEKRRDHEHRIPRQMIRQNERERTGHQPGDAIGIHMHRVAQTQLGLLQNLAPVGIERNVLCGREKGDGAGEPQNRGHILPGHKQAQRGNAGQQAQLGK